jgi:hypothetical protein
MSGRLRCVHEKSGAVQNFLICLPQPLITEASPVVQLDDMHRVSRDPKPSPSATKCQCPELASQVSRGPVPADRSRHGEHHYGIVIIGQGLRSSLSH